MHAQCRQEDLEHFVRRHRCLREHCHARSGDVRVENEGVPSDNRYVIDQGGDLDIVKAEDVAGSLRRLHLGSGKRSGESGDGAGG